MKNNEFGEFFDLINTTKDKQFKAYQIKQYGYLRGTGESVSKQVWNKNNTKPKPKPIPAKPKRKDYSSILATLKP
jgi:hypothetical protein